MASVDMYGVVMAVVLLSHQALMKPIYEKEENYQVNRLEKELESQKPTQIKSTESREENIGEWGDTVNGINVGNVIRDVLITLRDHPEIVRKLIADEERSLAEQVLNSERADKDDILLPVNVPVNEQRDFQLPSPQLQKSPMKVVKKMGNYKYEMKRQKETPEETIDMTGPVEGGSFENEDKSQESGEVKHLIKDTDQLFEGGTNQPSSIGLKRSQDSSDKSGSSSSSESVEPEDTSEAKSMGMQKSKKGKGAYWKNYGKQKQHQKDHQWEINKDESKSEDSNEVQSKGEFWKNHGKNKDKHGSDEDKGKFWKDFGKNKDNSNEETENINIDGDEVHDKSEDSSNSDENELFQLRKKKEHQAVM